MSQGRIALNNHTKVCPRAHYLISLLKSLNMCKSIKLTCNSESYPIVHENQYKSLILSITRKPSKQSEQLTKKTLLQSIEIIGASFKPSFFSLIASVIGQGRLYSITTLNLINCGIQDTEGIQITKAIILDRQTPCLESMSLSRN